MMIPLGVADFCSARWLDWAIPTIDAECRLTHWSWVMYICISSLTIISSDNGLLPGQHQAITWTNAGLLSVGLLGTNFSEILNGIVSFSFKKMHLKWCLSKWHTFCAGEMDFRWLCLCTFYFATILLYIIGEFRWTLHQDTVFCVGDSSIFIWIYNVIKLWITFTEQTCDR